MTAKRVRFPAARQRISGEAQQERHRHATAYAALILRGGYEEAGERGRVRVGAGDVVMHDAFDAHCDRFGQDSSEILNLPLSPRSAPSAFVGRVNNPDAIARAAEKDMHEAVAILFQSFEPADRRKNDWQDELAADLWSEPDLCLYRWASHHHLAPETISRGFARLYGVIPARFRADVRARRGWEMLRMSVASLADIAHRAGFADQPHFTREVARLTGRTPGAWRKSNLFKTQELR